MCENPTVIQATKVIHAVMPDGGGVTIAEIGGHCLSVESLQTGATFSPPPSRTLLLLSPGPETPLYSLDQLMEVFSASLFVMATIESELGAETLGTWIDFFGRTPTN